MIGLVGLISETGAELLRKSIDSVAAPGDPLGIGISPVFFGLKFYIISDEEADLVPGMGSDAMLFGSEKSISEVLTWVCAKRELKKLKAEYSTQDKED